MFIFQFFILIFVMFFGVVTQNDCCERILELPEVDVPIVSRGFEEPVSSFLISYSSIPYFFERLCILRCQGT